MNVHIHRVGHERQPVVTIDGFTGRVAEVADIASRMAPFPQSENHYPGLRRLITAQDKDASAYLTHCLRRIAPVLGRSFGARSFRCLEASFSMVTVPPAALSPRQRVPHFDSLDPNYVAVLHYVVECAGTAFYRQRSTGIEVLTQDNIERYRAGAEGDEDASQGYITASGARYERIGAVVGMADRVAIYRGALLHSGIIPLDFPMSSDPRKGRLTANFFLHVE